MAAARPFRWPVRVYYEDTDAAGVDALDVTLALIARGKSRHVAGRDVLHGEELVATARVTLACLDPNTWRPTHIPAPQLARMEVSA